MLVIYLLSLAFFVFVLLNGVGKDGVKAKLLIFLAVCVAGYNIYLIFSGSISKMIIINFVLSIIPFIVLIIGLILLFDSISNTSAINTQNSIQDNVSSFYKENIEDNELTQSNYQTTFVKSDVTDGLNDEINYINYKNAKINGYGSCDVEETKDYIKVTMKADGKEYEFYVKGPNIVAYRVEGMKNPKSY